MINESLVENILMEFIENDSSTESDSQSTTSTSSSSSSDEPGADTQQNGIHFMESILNFTEEQFRSHFRLSRTMVEDLQDKYTAGTQLTVSHGGREKIGAKKEVYVFLWYAANTVTFRQLGNLFGIAKSSAWVAVNRVSSWLVKISHEYIKWPSQEEMIVQEEKFRQKQGIPGVIGAIDGTHIKINAPKHDKQLYFNRKKYYSLGLQGVVDADKKFIDVCCGEPGSFHDSRVLRRSLLFRNATSENSLFPNGTFLIGDSAYPAKSWLVTPFKDNGNLTSQQIRFNEIHSSTRMVVENAFGLLKGKFRRLQFFTETKNLNICVNIIIAICVLHNYSIINGEGVYNLNEDVELEEFTTQESMEQGSVNGRREILINTLVDNGIL